VPKPPAPYGYHKKTVELFDFPSVIEEDNDCEDDFRIHREFGRKRLFKA
jgi:hypothetical protein